LPFKSRLRSRKEKMQEIICEARGRIGQPVTGEAPRHGMSCKIGAGVFEIRYRVACSAVIHFPPPNIRTHLKNNQLLRNQNFCKNSFKTRRRFAPSAKPRKIFNARTNYIRLAKFPVKAFAFDSLDKTPHFSQFSLRNFNRSLRCYFWDRFLLLPLPNRGNFFFSLSMTEAGAASTRRLFFWFLASAFLPSPELIVPSFLTLAGLLVTGSITTDSCAWSVPQCDFLSVWLHQCSGLRTFFKKRLRRLWVLPAWGVEHLCTFCFLSFFSGFN